MVKLERHTREIEDDAGVDRDDPSRAPVLDLTAVVAWCALIAAAVIWGHGLGEPRVLVGWPPLTAEWLPHVDWGLAVPILVAAGVLAGARLAARGLRWGPLLLVAVVAATAWMLSVNLWRGGGLDALAAPLANPHDYAAALDAFESPADVFGQYLEQLPDLPTHPRGHPPGPVFLLEVLDSLGVDDLRVVAILIVLAGASAVPAVAITLRRLARDTAAGDAASDLRPVPGAGGSDERLPRNVLPLLVLVPFAIWAATSMDAVFLAAAAWTAALWATARGRAGAAATGVAFGATLLLSYGLVLFVLVLAAIRRDVRSVLWAAAGVVAVLAAAALAGFWYWDGLRATRVEYLAGHGGLRPYGYWFVGDLALLAMACGPAVAVSVRRAGAGLIGRPRAILTSGPVLLVLAALVAAVASAASGFTKGEVERIWLPLMPWLLVCAGYTVRARPRADVEPGLVWPALGAAWTIALTAVFVTPW